MAGIYCVEEELRIDDDMIYWSVVSDMRDMNLKIFGRQAEADALVNTIGPQSTSSTNWEAELGSEGQHHQPSRPAP